VRVQEGRPNILLRASRALVSTPDLGEYRSSTATQGSSDPWFGLIAMLRREPQLTNSVSSPNRDAGLSHVEGSSSGSRITPPPYRWSSGV